MSPPPPTPFGHDYWHSTNSYVVTVNIFNFWFGLIVGGITEFSPLIYVTLVVTAAGALGNGFGFGSNEYSLVMPTPNRNLAMAIMAFLLYFVQELGLCFYSYFILNRILQRRPRRIYMAGFWFIFACTGVVHLAALISGLKKHPLWIWYDAIYAHFAGIAILEIWNAFWLLRAFLAARRGSADARHNGRSASLLGELIRSTEVRVGVLFAVGITRLVTNWINQVSKNVNTLTYVALFDGLAIMAEQFYPDIMMIDIIAARLARLADERYSGQVHHHKSPEKSGYRPDSKGWKLRPMGKAKTTSKMPLPSSGEDGPDQDYSHLTTTSDRV